MDNFQSGMKMVWDRFLDGKETDHVEVVEDGYGEGEDPRGTTEVELIARENKRQEMKRKQERMTEEL